MQNEEQGTQGMLPGHNNRQVARQQAGTRGKMPDILTSWIEWT
ncbi:UNVERIFIED_CONTAM: hypothetical protein ABIC26_003504 [Paenibacillus sp. PvR008]